MIPNELMPLKGTGSHWAISSEDVKSDEKVHWVTLKKNDFDMPKPRPPAESISIVHILQHGSTEKRWSKQKGSYYELIKLFFQANLFASVTPVKLKFGDVEQPSPSGCTANCSWFFGIGKVITFPILASCMLFAICMLLQFSLSLLFPPSKHRKGAAFLEVLRFFWRCFQPSKCQRQTTKRGGKKGIASGSARHYQNRITSSCAALAAWPVDQGNQTIFTHSKQNGWCGIKRKLRWKRWED